MIKRRATALSRGRTEENLKVLGTMINRTDPVRSPIRIIRLISLDGGKTANLSRGKTIKNKKKLPSKSQVNTTNK